MESEELRVLKRIEDLLKKHMPGSAKKSKVAGDSNGNPGTFRATAANSKDLDDSIVALNTAFKGLTKEVRISRATFYSLNKTMRANAQLVKQQPPDGAKEQPGKIASFFSRLTSPFKKVGDSVEQAEIAVTKFSAKTTVMVGLLKEALPVLREVVNDIFMLQARGVGAQSLSGLYLDAIRAGMSLDEYTSMLESSITSVSRSGGFEEYGKQIRSTTDQLSKLGIFGPAAAKLAAEFQESAVTLGVPQAQLANTSNGLTSQFERLRKTSMITADVFADLLNGVKENQEAQRELLGLAPFERAQRLQAQVQMATFGKTLGLSTQLTKEFGDAMLSQRASKYTERFEGAGRVRQIAAFTGMDATEAERLARYAKVKNTSTLSAAEIADYQNLAAKLEGGLQSKMNSGRDGTVAIAELYKETIANLPINRMMDVSGKVQLAKDSGPTANKDFANSVGKFGRFVGDFATIVNGLGQNPIAGFGAVILGAVGGLLMAKLGGVAPAIGAVAGSIASIPVKLAGAVAATSGMLKNAMTSSLSVAKAIPEGLTKSFLYVKSVAQMMIEPFRTVGKTIETVTDVAKHIGPKIAQAVSGAFKVFGVVLKGASIAGLIIDPIVEMFTGTISSAFSPDAGWMSRIGEVIFAGFRGLFTGVTGLLDTVFGTTLTNTVDKVFVMLRAVGLRSLKWAIDSFTSIMPDSLVPDFMNDLSANLTKSIDNADTVLAKLASDENSTLTTIGKKNKEANKAQVDDAKKTNDQLKKIQQQTNNVVYGTKNLAQSVSSTAQQINNSMPVPNKLNNVVQPTVNNQEQQTVVGSQSQSQQPAPLNNPEVISLLAQLVALLQQSVATENMQTQYLEALSRLGVRVPNLGNNQDMIEKVYRG